MTIKPNAPTAIEIWRSIIPPRFSILSTGNFCCRDENVSQGTRCIRDMGRRQDRISMHPGRFAPGGITRSRKFTVYDTRLARAPIQLLSPKPPGEPRPAYFYVAPVAPWQFMARTLAL